MCLEASNSPQLKVVLVENVNSKQCHFEQHFKCKVSALFLFPR